MGERLVPFWVKSSMHWDLPMGIRVTLGSTNEGQGKTGIYQWVDGLERDCSFISSRLPESFLNVVTVLLASHSCSVWEVSLSDSRSLLHSCCRYCLRVNNHNEECANCWWIPTFPLASVSRRSRSTTAAGLLDVLRSCVGQGAELKCSVKSLLLSFCRWLPIYTRMITIFGLSGNLISLQVSALQLSFLFRLKAPFTNSRTRARKMMTEITDPGALKNCLEVFLKEPFEPY